MQGDQKPIQAFCFHSEHLCRPARRRTSTWPGSPPLSRAPGTRADRHPHIAGAARCDPAPSEPGGRGEEVRTRQQGPRGAVTVALPGHRRGSRLGHDPPSPDAGVPGSPPRARTGPRGEVRGARRGTRAWGHAHSGGVARSGRKPPAGVGRARSGRGGRRSQGREVGCAGGGTHGRAGEGAHSVRSSVLGPAARPAPQAPNPEPGARSGGPARRPRPHAACGSRPRPLPAAPTPAPAPAPPGLSCVLRPSVRPRRSPASA